MCIFYWYVYILILSCSVVSYEKKEKEKEKRKRRKALIKIFPLYLMKLVKNSIVPLVHFVILYTLNFVRYSLGYYCIYLGIPVYCCASLRVDCDGLTGMWFQWLKCRSDLNENMRRQCDITAERLIFFVSRMYVNANYTDTEKHCVKIHYTLVRRFTNIANSIARGIRLLCTLQWIS